MKKNLKLLLIVLVVAIAATLTCALMPACGGNGGTAYSVKVVCSEENFDYTQITAQWCATNQNNAIGSCYGAPVKLDANGEASQESLPNDFIENQKGWHVQINIPTSLKNQGYSYDAESQSLYVTAPGTVTITLTKSN